MAREKKATERIASFEESVKASMGAKWKKVSKEDREIVHQMSECQEKGGPIGSAVIEDELG